MAAPQKVQPTSKLAVEPKTTTSLINDSSANDFSREQINIYGPPKTGKTFCALSISQFWPKTPGDGKAAPIAPKLTRLDDVLHIDFDGNGGTGLREQNLIVPTINVPQLMTPKQNGPYAKSILQALTMLVDETAKWADQAKKTHGNIAIVSDTITTFDSDLCKYWDDNCPTTKSGAKDTRAMWTCLANSHKRYHQAMRFMPANIIFNFHAKANIENDSSKEGQDQVKKMSAAGLKPIGPAITGKAISLYTGIGSTILWMSKRKSPSGKMERTLHTQGFGEVLVECRWQRGIEAEEEPNLQKLFAKIRAASK